MGRTRSASRPGVGLTLSLKQVLAKQCGQQDNSSGPGKERSRSSGKGERPSHSHAPPTMGSSDASVYLSAVKWTEEGFYLKEFTEKFTLPQVAKVIKGQYLNLGVPSLPSPSLNQVVFLASAGKRLKIAAQCVKFKENRRVVAVGPKLAIPDTYEGWFEILSEDGRAVRCIESVAELVKRFPQRCLVREAVKAFLARDDNTSATGGGLSDKTRTLPVGETLVLANEILTTSSSSATNSSSSSSRTNKMSSSSSGGRFLRCYTSRGETVYLSLEQRGRFSIIASEDNISGVHTVRTLISKRFPLMVRLVHGRPPNVGGSKINSRFAPEMRLYTLFEEESLVALPLSQSSRDTTSSFSSTASIVTLSPTSPLKVAAPKNAEALVNLPEYTSLTERCQDLIEQVSDRIQVFDISVSKELRNCRRSSASSPSHQYVFDPARPYKSPSHPSLVRRSISDPQGTSKVVIHLERGLSSPAAPQSVDTSSRVPKTDSDVKAEGGATFDHRYDEIDEIYDYVRGFAPLPERIKSDFCDRKSMYQSPPGGADDQEKPEPPPVETIPARKISVDSNAGSVSTHRITVSIINRTLPKEKKDHPHHLHPPLVMTPPEKAEEHIYEKLVKKSPEVKKKTKSTSYENHHLHPQHHLRIPLRSSSSSKVYIQNGHHSHTNKMFIKSSSPQRSSSQKSRFLKHFKTGGGGNAPKDGSLHKNSRRLSASSGKALSTSPLFNIRYKSLTNLAVDFNTLDSSHSGGQTSSGSGDSKEERLRTRKLPRPKSLCNLFLDVNRENRYNLVQNDLIKVPSNPRKLILAHDSTSSHSGRPSGGTQSKKIGTLYL